MRQQGDLYIPIDRPQRNGKNGQFLKGHTPHNKGKKWSDYMGKRAMKRAAKGWANIITHRPPRCPGAGRNKRPIIAVSDEGKWLFFPDITTAGAWNAVLNRIRVQVLSQSSTTDGTVDIELDEEDNTDPSPTPTPQPDEDNGGEEPPVSME